MVDSFSQVSSIGIGGRLMESIKGVLAGALSLLTVAVAWVFYRPVLGVGLLVGAVGLLVVGKLVLGKKKAA